MDCSGREVRSSNYCQFHTLARPMKLPATKITPSIIVPLDAVWAFIDSSSPLPCPFSSFCFTPQYLQSWTIASKWRPITVLHSPEAWTLWPHGSIAQTLWICWQSNEVVNVPGTARKLLFGVQDRWTMTAFHLLVCSAPLLSLTQDQAIASLNRCYCRPDLNACDICPCSPHPDHPNVRLTP